MNLGARKEIKTFIVEGLKQDLVEKSGGKVPRERQTLNKTVEARAEQLLTSFEDSVLAHDIKQLIVKDCKKELTEVSLRQRAVEAILLILTLILAALLCILSSSMSPVQIHRLADWCLALNVIIVGLLVYLKLRS
ncbi:MAG: hypothetical protein HQK56_12435 [Deltaproteobacteria bacterium]|nr:hypothetical protein [Deltaproteobacteria bacterium]